MYGAYVKMPHYIAPKIFKTSKSSASFCRIFTRNRLENAYRKYFLLVSSYVNTNKLL